MHVLSVEKLCRWLRRRSPLPAPSAPTSPRKRGEVRIIWRGEVQIW